jgi:hypothetical protein
MNTHADKTQENKSQTVAAETSQTQSGGESTFQFVDNRPEAVEQRKLQEMANNSLQVKQLMAFQDMANNSQEAKKTAQLRSMADNHSAQQEQPIQKKENNTGLPDNLKTGMENLSGLSLDDVKVYRNSDKPAQLQAHAYAQGSDIHLGSGQEKHLPHEAWHVVQQKQGRVKPTMQMKGKVNVNDNAGLEKEADVMGTKAIQFVDNRPDAVAQRKLQEMANNSPQFSQLMAFQDMTNNSPKVNQLRAFKEMENSRMASIQLLANPHAQGTTIHLDSGKEGQLSHESHQVDEKIEGGEAPTLQMKGEGIANEGNVIQMNPLGNGSPSKASKRRARAKAAKTRTQNVIHQPGTAAETSSPLAPPASETTSTNTSEASSGSPEVAGTETITSSAETTESGGLLTEDNLEIIGSVVEAISDVMEAIDTFKDSEKSGGEKLNAGTKAVGSGVGAAANVLETTGFIEKASQEKSLMASEGFKMISAGIDTYIAAKEVYERWKSGEPLGEIFDSKFGSLKDITDRIGSPLKVVESYQKAFNGKEEWGGRLIPGIDLISQGAGIIELGYNVLERWQLWNDVLGLKSGNWSANRNKDKYVDTLADVQKDKVIKIIVDLVGTGGEFFGTASNFLQVGAIPTAAASAGGKVLKASSSIFSTLGLRQKARDIAALIAKKTGGWIISESDDSYVEQWLVAKSKSSEKLNKLSDDLGDFIHGNRAKPQALTLLKAAGISVADKDDLAKVKDGVKKAVLGA